MKIAMIHTPILGRSGGDRQVLTLADELQKLGHTVEIFVSRLNKENSYPNLLKNLTINVVPHPLEKNMPKWLMPLERTLPKQTKTQNKKQTSQLREWMRKTMGRQFYTIPYELPTMINIGRKIPKGFDIINNHNYPSEWAAFTAKKRLHAPIVWMCNEPPFWYFVPELTKGLRKLNWPVYSLLDRTTAKYIDEIIVLSHIAGGYVRRAYNRSSKVVRSGIDPERFWMASGAKVREELGMKKAFVLLQVGNIEINKRQADSVKALKILSKKYNDVKLIFDGGGRRDELIWLAKKLGVIDKVVFLRSGSDEELTQVYAACDVFLFPAQITWGLAVVEAMSAGKTVIVSNRCGVSEIIQNNVNGVVVEHANPVEIAKQTERLINNKDLRLELGRNAAAFVRNKFSWGKYAKQMELIFQDAARRYPK